MKHILLLTLLLLSSLFAKSSDFSVVVTKPFNDALFDITEDYDRSISAIGFSNIYVKHNRAQESYTNPFDYLESLSSDYGTQMQLIKVAQNADILLSKSAKLPDFNEAIALVKTPQNGYFVGGYTLDGSLLVVKLDANANVVFVKKFGTKNYDRMNNLILMSDGGVLAIGSSITSRSPTDNMFETGLGLNDIYLTRFSKNGQKLWSKKYGTQYDDRGIDAVEARDGSIVVISTTSYDKNKDVTLMRITENGNKIWLKHYKSKELTVPYKIIRLRDDNFLVSLSQFDTMQKEQIRLIKFDLYKNVLIDKYIRTTYPSVLKDIKEFSDGTLIGVGYVNDTYNTDGLVMIIDSNLVMLTQEHYGSKNYDVFNAVTILHNSQAAAAGIYTNDNSQESNMWIAKFNKDATMVQIAQKAPDLYLKLQTLFRNEIKKHQLVIKKDLSISLTSKALYFQQGVYTLTQEQKDFLNSFGKKLSHFLLNYKDSIECLEINGHTSQEWQNTHFTNRYLKNEKLSLERAYAVLSYIFTTQDTKTQHMLVKLLKGSGSSYKEQVLSQESDERSRKVSFKIILK
jgi:outer membrane protein OmpA-like peptidoglycan-associated protein